MNITSLKFFKDRHIFILIILGLLPITWFRFGYLLRPEEVGYIDYSYLFEKFLFAWSEHSTNGSPVSYADHLALFPVGFLYKFFELIHVSPLAAQYIILIAYLETTLISMYLLVKHLIKDSLTALYASIFYGSTFYMLSTFFYTSKMIQMAITPMLFYLFFSYLETRKTKYIIYNFLLLLLCAGLFTNPANAATTLVIYPLCFLYYLIGKPHLNKVTVFKRALYFIMPLIPVFAYVLLVYYFSILIPELYKKTQENAYSHVFLATRISLVLQNFRGAWWEFQEEYNSWLFLLSSKPSIFAALSLSSIVLVGFYTVKEQLAMKKYTYWLLVFLCFILLVKGVSEPFGFVYNLLFRHLPGFFVFRESWAKFTPPLIFSATMAFSFTVFSLLKSEKAILVKFTRYLLTIVLLITSLPFFLGGPYNRSQSSNITTIDVKVPDYWKDLKTWSRSHTSANVLSFPLIYGEQAYYYWYANRVGNFRGNLASTLLHSNDSVYIRSSDLFALRGVYSPRLFSSLNVSYILDQRDVINAELDAVYDIQQLKADGIINSEPDMSFGKLDLYQVTESFTLPKIYVADSVWNYSGKPVFIPLAFNLPDLPRIGNWIFVSNQLGINTGQFVINNIIAPSRLKSVKRDFNSWSEGWAWPVRANTNPMSWLYKLIRIKESLTLISTLDPLKRIEIMSWLLAKRAAEVNNYNLTTKVERDLYNDYFEALSVVFQTIKDVEVKQRDEEYWEVVGKTVMYAARSNRALESAGASEDFVAQLNDIYDGFISWLNDTANPTCTDYCFEVIPNKTESYDLVLSKVGLEGIVADKVSVEIRSNEDVKKYSAVEKSGNWFSFGPLSLNAGQKYKIGFTFPEPENLVGQEAWKLIEYSTKFDRIEMEPQALNFGPSVETTKLSTFDRLIFGKTLNGWEPGKSYDISFDYYTNNGVLGVVVVEDVLDFGNVLRRNQINHISTAKKLSYRSELESVCGKDRYLLGECEGRFHDTVVANSYSRGARIYIYGYGKEEKIFPDILMENLKVNKVWQPFPFLKMGAVYETLASTASYTRVSPVEYSITLQPTKTPSVLVFSQNYNPGWKLYQSKISEENSIIAILAAWVADYLPINWNIKTIDDHFIANGYANAWVIPASLGDAEEIELKLEYWPQRLFNLVTYFLVVLIVLSLGYLFLSITRLTTQVSRNKHDNKDN